MKKVDILLEGYNVGYGDLDELDDTSAANTLDSTSDNKPCHVLGSST